MGIEVWTDVNGSLAPWSVTIMEEDVPVGMADDELPEPLEEVHVAGDIRRIGGYDFPLEFRSLLRDSGAGAELAGCTIPIKPKEASGALILVAVGSERTGPLEMSLARIASVECALALERAAGRGTNRAG